MNILKSILIKFRITMNALMWLPPLISRIVLSFVFVESGWGKIHHLDKVTAFFTELGLPMPAFQAILVSTTEFSCGLLLLTGLCTRLASIPLIIIMGVAIASAKREELNGFSDLIGFSEFLYVVLLVGLIVNGAGLLSLDFILGRKMKNLS